MMTRDVVGKYVILPIVRRLVFKEEKGRVLRANISPCESSTAAASWRKESVLIGRYVISDDGVPHADCV